MQVYIGNKGTTHTHKFYLLLELIGINLTPLKNKNYI